MKEYLVHYRDKETDRVTVFYFVDYKNLDMLMKDLKALDFENTYGEVLDMEKVVIDECADIPATA